MPKPFVSVVINNYNYERFVGDAISSALNQTYAPMEVIVVDDGSSDGSRSVIEGFAREIVIVSKSNGGQASAFNAGFAKSSGEIICLLDADDVLLPNKVEKIVDAYVDGATGWCFIRCSTLMGCCGLFLVPLMFAIRPGLLICEAYTGAGNLCSGPRQPPG